MATVPEADIPAVQSEAIPGRAIPRFADESSPADFGGTIGTAVERTGERLGAEQKQEAKAAADKAQREADQVRIAQANTTLSGWVTGQLYTDENAAYKQQGSDAIGMDQKYMPKFDDQVAQIAESLTPSQAAAFQVHAAGQRDEMNLGLARYEKEAGDRTAQQTYSAAFDQQTAAMGLNWRGMSDEKTWQTAKGNLTMSGEAAADRLKLGKKETVGALVDKGITAVVDTALADGGLGSAARFLEGHKDELSNSAIYPQLKEKINAKMKQAEAELKDGLKEKWTDATQGALNGIRGSENMISDRELQILYPHDWKEKRSFLGKAAITGASEQKFDQMSPAEGAAELDASDPRKLPAHEGQGDDLQLWNMKQAAWQRSITKRQADPRAFANQQYGDPQIDWSKDTNKAGDIINARAATTADDSRRLGVNMQLLSKPEAAQLSAALAAAPPDQQLGMLTRMRDSVESEPTFRALMEQVRPNSPIIAEAALRTPRNPDTAPLWYNARYDNDANAGREILAGDALLHPEGALKAEEGKGGISKGVVMPTDEMLRQKFNSEFGKALFAGNPVAADHAYAAWKSVYAFGIAHSGDLSGNMNAKAAENATKMVKPNTDSHFGSPVPVPAGMDPSTFPDRVRDALTASLKNGGYDPKLFKGHALVQLGRMDSGDYGVLGADGTNLAVYPGTNKVVRVHLDEQFRRSSPTRPQRPTTRQFPERPSPPSRGAPNYEADIPGQYPKNNPADTAPAVE